MGLYPGMEDRMKADTSHKIIVGGLVTVILGMYLALIALIAASAYVVIDKFIL